MSRHSVRTPNSSAFWTSLCCNRHTKGKTQFETNCCCRLRLRGARFWPSGGMMQYAYMSWAISVCGHSAVWHTETEGVRHWGSRVNLVQPYSLNVVRSKQILSLHCCNIFRPTVTICTDRFNVQQFYVLPTHCIYVFWGGSENKQRLFHCTALNYR